MLKAAAATNTAESTIEAQILKQLASLLGSSPALRALRHRQRHEDLETVPAWPLMARSLRSLWAPELHSVSTARAGKAQGKNHESAQTSGSTVAALNSAVQAVVSAAAA